MTKKRKSRKILEIYFLSFLSLVLFSACYNMAEEKSAPLKHTTIHSLMGFKNTAEFEEYAKKAALDYMKAQVNATRNEELRWNSSNSGRAATGIEWSESPNDMALSDDMAAAPGDASAPTTSIGLDGGTTESAASGEKSADFSTTNVQEEGVDEADLVKTDGDYIYVLYAGQLVIIEAGQDGEMNIQGKIEIGGYALEMFVLGNKAVVFSYVDKTLVPEEMHHKERAYSQNYPSYDIMPMPGMDIDIMEDERILEETSDEMPDLAVAPDYDYISRPALTCGQWGCSGGTYTQVAILDLSDKTNPELVNKLGYAAEYITSRMINGSVRAVLDSTVNPLEMIWDYGTEVDWSSQTSINKMHDNIINYNIDYINGLSLEDFMPKKYNHNTSDVSWIVEPTQVSAPTTPNGIGLQTVVSLNLKDTAAPVSEAAVFAQKGLVYASTESLYLTSNRDYIILIMDSGLWGDAAPVTTGIHKFDISNPENPAIYLATGEVEGRLLDQFCMGEKDGYLRVATTTGSRWNPSELENHVHVLEQQGNTLEQIGHLGGLGLEEEIYAARFIGDRGFMVTFYETDPLYTLDLSDPTNPVAIGEWKGPGYSTYLHPWGDDMIISMGMENWQLALSIFDISDFADPRLVDRYFFEGDFSSAALNEHKAFTFNPATGFLALPYSRWIYTNQTSTNDTGIMIFNLTKTEITLESTLSFLGEENNFNESAAVRSLYINDYMYGVSRCRIVSSTLEDPSVPVFSLPLFEDDYCAEQNYYYHW